MTLIIPWLFKLIGLIAFLAIIGLPVWAVIYLIKQFKKNGRFSAFQIILAIITTIIFINILRGMAGFALYSIRQDYGVDVISSP